MKRYLVISGSVAIIVGVLGAVQVSKDGDPAAVISEVETKLTKAFEPRPIPVPPSLKGKARNITLIRPAWSDIENIWESLTWQNKKIAQAKAMLNYDSKTPSMDSYAWDNRESLATAAWHIQEANQLLSRKFQWGVGGAAVGFAATFLFLVLITWLWKFFLDRIRELSNAIRGK